MTPNSTAEDPNLPKKARRDAAREKARIDREREQKRRRRNKFFTQGGIIVGVVAVLAVVSLVIVNSVKSSEGPLNMASDGIVLSGEILSATRTPALEAGATPVANEPTSDPLSIVIYVDYMCPYCGLFESYNGGLVEDLVTNGVATLEIHPIAILDSQSLGSKYSTRAAAAVACVANYAPDYFYPAHMALFADQPEEGTSGLTNAEILNAFEQTGVSNDDVTTCVNEGRFTGWVTDATKRVVEGGVPASDLNEFPGTPTVVISGVAYTGHPADADAFQEFVSARIAAATARD